MKTIWIRLTQISIYNQTIFKLLTVKRLAIDLQKYSQYLISKGNNNFKTVIIILKTLSKVRRVA